MPTETEQTEPQASLDELIKSSAERSQMILKGWVSRKDDLWVSPGALGLRLKFGKAKGTNEGGAEITRVDPRCSFKEQVAVGDRIVTIDDKKITSMEDVKLNKDRVRKLGIVKCPRSVMEAEQNRRAAKKAKRSKKSKGSGSPAKKAEGVVDLTKKPAETANGSKNPGPMYQYPPPYHPYPYPPFPPGAYPPGFMVPRPADAEPPRKRGRPRKSKATAYAPIPTHLPPPILMPGPPPPPGWKPPPHIAVVPPGMAPFPHLSAMGLTVNDPYTKRRRRDLLSELLQYNKQVDIQTIAKMPDGKYYAVDLGDEEWFDEEEESAATLAWVTDDKHEKRPGYQPPPIYSPGKKKGKKAKSLPGASRKSLWTDQEDQIILRAMRQHKETWGDIPFHNWSGLATELNGRIGKQVRDRWTNYLDPQLSKEPFDANDVLTPSLADPNDVADAQDLKLWEAYRLNPKRWKEISTMQFKGTRSENQVKNRWNSAKFKKFVLQRFGEEAYEVENAKDICPVVRDPDGPSTEKDGEEEGADEWAEEEEGAGVEETLEEMSEEENNDPDEKEGEEI